MRFPAGFISTVAPSLPLFDANRNNGLHLHALSWHRRKQRSLAGGARRARAGRRGARADGRHPGPGPQGWWGRVAGRPGQRGAAGGGAGAGRGLPPFSRTPARSWGCSARPCRTCWVDRYYIPSSAVLSGSRVRYSSRERPPRWQILRPWECNRWRCAHTCLTDDFFGSLPGLMMRFAGPSRGCPGSTCICPVWLELCQTLSLSRARFTSISPIQLER